MRSLLGYYGTRHGHTSTSAMQTGAKFGMQLMDDALFHHWKGERVTVEDVLAKAHRPDDLAKRIVQSRRGMGDEAVPIQDED